jgi:hypothetical protein
MNSQRTLRLSVSREKENGRWRADQIALPESVAVRRPLPDKIFGWLTIVDHKRLGILYILLCVGDRDHAV